MADQPGSLHDALLKIAVLETQLQGMRDSVKLQAYEYERRLTELNHAHAQATQDKQKFVNSDLFYSKMDELHKQRAEADQLHARLLHTDIFTFKMAEIDKRLGDIDNWRSRIIGIGIGASMAGGVAGGGTAALLMKLFGQG